MGVSASGIPDSGVTGPRPHLSNPGELAGLRTRPCRCRAREPAELESWWRADKAVAPATVVGRFGSAPQWGGMGARLSERAGPVHAAPAGRR